MPSVREIKRRIQSVKNITQVTRALEAVSASKARRAQQQAERSRPYTQGAWEILVNLAGQPGMTEHPLLQKQAEIKAITVVLVTSDRGLAGAYNMNIIRVAEEFAARLNAEVRWVTVGRKGRDYLIRRRRHLLGEFSDLPAALRFSDITAINQLIVNDFLSGASQRVFIAYTDFINVLAQRPVVLPLLPLQPFGEMVAGDYFKEAPAQTVSNREYIYEPNASVLLDTIVPRFTALQIYQAILEANASEHAARMVAMRNATENGVALAGDLTLEYNKARQAAITAEILDIVGGVEALKESGKDKEAAAVVREADEFIKSVGAALKEKDGQPADKPASAPASKPKASTPPPSPAAEGALSPSGKPLQRNGQDNLQAIEGIGPKVEEALHKSGISSFAQIAQTEGAELERLVKEVHQVRILKGAAQTWPKQAGFLVAGDMAGLQAYQDRLVGGREPE
jgi:F-type H+-transporting ATPase subunit gamma